MSDIKTFIGYVLAAKRAEQAGFDFVEISLPMQFLEKRYNRRDDKYGGSLENRLVLMTALKRAVGDRLGVTIRFETDTVNGDHRIEAPSAS